MLDICTKMLDFEQLKGSVQECVKSEIDALNKKALNVFTLVIYIGIG